MSIDSIGASSLSALTQIPMNTPLQGTDADGDHDGSVGRASGGHRAHGGGAFMKSVLQALGQSGVDTGDQSSSNSGVSQALHAFMHSLFGALHAMTASQSGGASGSDPVSAVTGSSSGSGAVDSDGDHDGSGQAAGVASGYGSPSTRLQSLIQALGDGQGGTQSPAVAELQSAFQNLVTAMNGNSQAANGTSPTLQSFLRNLLPDLNTQPSLQSAAVGGMANTTA
jgi:hypothetical protein